MTEILERTKDDDGRTVLHLAAGSGHLHVCSYLVQQLKLNVNVKDDKGDTPLNLAILIEQYDTSVYLLDHGAWPTALNNQGFTALHHATSGGKKLLVQLLILRGADVDAYLYVGTPLYSAVARGKKDVVEFLLENHANVCKKFDIG